MNGGILNHEPYEHDMLEKSLTGRPLCGESLVDCVGVMILFI